MTDPTQVGLPALQQHAYSQYKEAPETPPPQRHTWRWAMKLVAYMTVGAALVMMILVAVTMAIIPFHSHGTGTLMTVTPSSVMAGPDDSITPPGPATLAQVPDAMRMIDPSTAAPTSADQKFLDDVTYLSPNVVITDRAKAVATGHLVCAQMDAGYSMTQVARQLVARDPASINLDAADSIVVAAVWDYCPEHKPEEYQH